MGFSPFYEDDTYDKCFIYTEWLLVHLKFRIDYNFIDTTKGNLSCNHTSIKNIFYFLFTLGSFQKVSFGLIVYLKHINKTFKYANM